MKYLVNRETKEHVVYDENDARGEQGIRSGYWRVVEADDEGWIKWDGKSNKCPLPDDAKVSVRWNYSDKISSDSLAGDWSWNDSQLAFYRPIFPAESKPEPSTKIKRFATVTDGGSAFIADFDTRHASANIFDRLSAAVAASESIPALIAEINAMLPEGYCVTQTAQVMAEPKTHPSWDEEAIEVNGFRVGDYVECIRDQDSSGLLKAGTIYIVRSIQNGELVFHENDCSWMTSRFNRLSRPEAK